MMERKCGPNGVWEDVDFSMCIKSDLVSIFVEASFILCDIHKRNSCGRILSVKFCTSVLSIKENKLNFLYQQVSQVRDGYDTNNISGILRDFSQQTAEITSNENITSGDLDTSVEIINKVAAISVGREDLVTDSDTQVSIYTGHKLMQSQQLTQFMLVLGIMESAII